MCVISSFLITQQSKSSDGQYFTCKVNRAQRGPGQSYVADEWTSCPFKASLTQSQGLHHCASRAFATVPAVPSRTLCSAVCTGSWLTKSRSGVDTPGSWCSWVLFETLSPLAILPVVHRASLMLLLSFSHL